MAILDKLIEVGPDPQSLENEERCFKVTVTARRDNVGTVYIGNEESQSTDLGPGDSVDIEGHNVKLTFVRGTAGDKVAILGSF
jgi:hypothetical protein